MKQTLPREGIIFQKVPKKSLFLNLNSHLLFPIISSICCLILFAFPVHTASSTIEIFSPPKVSAQSRPDITTYTEMVLATPTPTLAQLSSVTPTPQPITNPPSAPSHNTFIEPVLSFIYISTYFSGYHPGVDLVDPLGTTIYASANGIVSHAGWSNEGYGNMIEIAHPDGFHTLYAHLAEVDVAAGQSVTSGQTIGRVGCTGNCTGSHLHFEIHDSSGIAINPLLYF